MFRKVFRWVGVGIGAYQGVGYDITTEKILPKQRKIGMLGTKVITIMHPKK